MNADGTGQTMLTNDGAADVAPSWSPDGTKITFSSTKDGNFEIYSMNADGTGQTRLTTNTAADNISSWSPDGTKIAFSSGRDGNGEIYVMKADGTGQTRLTTNDALDADPEWQTLAPPSPPNNPVGGIIIPMDIVPLFVAGLFSNAFWMIPTLGGIAGAAMVLFKIKRKNG